MPERESNSYRGSNKRRKVDEIGLRKQIRADVERP